MRIKFISHEDYDSPVGQEWQGELKAVGHTIVNGHRIAANGILKPFVEDITQYKTVLVDGVKTQVEVVSEPISEPISEVEVVPEEVPEEVKVK